VSQSTPEHVIAIVALHRAVDRLLADAEEVRQKREDLNRLLRDIPLPEDRRPEPTAPRKGVRPHG